MRGKTFFNWSCRDDLDPMTFYFIWNLERSISLAVREESTLHHCKDFGWSLKHLPKLFVKAFWLLPTTCKKVLLHTEKQLQHPVICRDASLFSYYTISTIIMLHTCHMLYTWYCNLTPMHCMNIIFKQYLHVARVLKSKVSQASNCSSEHTNFTVEDNSSSETKNTSKIIIPSGIFRNILTQI